MGLVMKIVVIGGSGLIGSRLVTKISAGNGGKMSTPAGDNAFLYELELNVRAALTQAGTSRPEEEAVRIPIDEWLFDPADVQRYEIGLRALLGAIKALEGGSGPRRPSCARRDAGERQGSRACARRPQTGTETEGW
jgi:hypothetical protein